MSDRAREDARVLTRWLYARLAEHGGGSDVSRYTEAIAEMGELPALRLLMFWLTSGAELPELAQNTEQVYSDSKALAKRGIHVMGGYRPGDYDNQPRPMPAPKRGCDD